jgi:uncharacterized protein (DUF2342 family)
MNFYRAVRAVADTSGSGPIDWGGVSESSKAVTASGDLDLSSDEIEGYHDDVCAARDRVRTVGGIDFDLPGSIEVQHRHHWIDANIGTFGRILDKLDTDTRYLPGIVRTVNTGSMAVSISFLANNVLGQYDPGLLSPSEEHALYFVHPNIERIADRLSVDLPRFRRWIAFHEVTHAAEFGTAPWLTDHLEELIEDVIGDLSSGQFNRGDFRQIDVTMTAVEGYAELLMDKTFDKEYEDLRRKLDERRQGGRPFTRIMRHLLGLGRKRRQYERGKDFFESVATAQDVQTAAIVWEQPDNLPTDEELDDPSLWLSRMGV